MNTKNLIFRPVTPFLILIALACFFQCEEKKSESDKPDDVGTRISDDESMVTYRLFNLELAVEEAYHIQKASDANGDKTSGKAACMVALEELKDTCDFDCRILDYACLQEYLDCKAATETASRSTSNDGDGAEPLPIASDTTSVVADVDLTEMVVFSDDPEASQFTLTTNEGELYATSDRSSKSYRYDKEKRQAVYKIQVKDPELANQPLTIHLSTVIVNAAGEKRVIEIKHPFGLAFTR